MLTNLKVCLSVSSQGHYVEIVCTMSGKIYLIQFISALSLEETADNKFHVIFVVFDNASLTMIALNST